MCAWFHDSKSKIAFRIAGREQVLGQQFGDAPDILPAEDSKNLKDDQGKTRRIVDIYENHEIGESSSRRIYDR
jgi:hypothetical protein